MKFETKCRFSALYTKGESFLSLNVLPARGLYNPTHSNFRMKFLIVAALLSALLFWAGCSTTPSEQAYSNPEPRPIKTDNSRARKSLVFPKTIAGIPFRNLEVYESKHPGYGVGYQYEDSDTQLDISVFDGGYPEIADGIFSDTVHLQFEEAKKQIVAIEQQGFYKIISIVSDDWIQVGDQPFLYFSYTFENGFERKSSYLMLTGYDGNFLKIRLTTDAQLDTQVFDAFMTDFGNLISANSTS